MKALSLTLHAATLVALGILTVIWMQAQGDLREAEFKLEEAREEVAVLQDHVESDERGLGRLKTDLSQGKGEVVKIEERVSALVRDLAEAQAAHLEKEEQFAELQGELAGLNRQQQQAVDARDKELQRLKLQLTQSQTKARTRQNELTQQNYILNARSQELAKVVQKLEVDLARARHNATKPRKNRVLSQSK